MKKYLLRYAKADGREASDCEVEARDMSDAFKKAQNVSARWPIEIWEGDKLVCTIERDPQGHKELWIVNG